MNEATARIFEAFADFSGVPSVWIDADHRRRVKVRIIEDGAESLVVSKHWLQKEQVYKYEVEPVAELKTLLRMQTCFRTTD